MVQAPPVQGGPCKVGLSDESAPLDDPENHSPAKLRGTDQTLRRGTGLGPGLNRLSSGSALVRLELRVSCLGAG